MISIASKNLRYFTKSKQFNKLKIHRINLLTNKYKFNFSANKQSFASKKNLPPKTNIKNQIQQTKQIIVEQSGTQFLWKLNTACNVFGIAGTFYNSSMAFIFVITINSMIQVYQSGTKLNTFKQLVQKSRDFNTQKLQFSAEKIKSILKELLITNGILLLFSISIGFGIMFPSLNDYSLMALNFWILFNLKINKISQGYYIALFLLLMFDFFYFQKIFTHKESQKQSKLAAV